jgi:hypothetical protein
MARFPAFSGQKQPLFDPYFAKNPPENHPLLALLRNLFFGHFARSPSMIQSLNHPITQSLNSLMAYFSAIQNSQFTIHNSVVS